MLQARRSVSIDPYTGAADGGCEKNEKPKNRRTMEVVKVPGKCYPMSWARRLKDVFSIRTFKSPSGYQGYSIPTSIIFSVPL